MSFLNNIFGDSDSKKVKKLAVIVNKINALEREISLLSDADLADKTSYFKGLLTEGKNLDDILPEVFAVVREVAKRVVSMRHFDVQLIGGMILHQGDITEMKTGEGKTLVATLPAYLNALSGKGVHIVTVNDYLSRRDAVWMGQIFAFLGLSVSVINSQQQSFMYDKGHTEVDQDRDELGSFKIFYEFLRPCSRKEAYEADITYGTNNEFGFDYLRDNIAYSAKEVVQRGFSYAIVDEIDSILIDEARTPLIISAPAGDSEDLYTKFSQIAEKLHEEEDFEVDEKLKAITLNDNGISKAEKLLGIDNIYTDKGIKYVHHLDTAVRAKALFKKDKEYVVRDGEVVIVDEFTGRLQPGRRWSEGLHQAIEAKEGLKIQNESRTFASITFQNYFRLYDKLSGMTGTAKTSGEEFYKVYGLDTIVVPTNREIERIDRNDLIFQTETGKFKAIARKVKEVNDKGQPVLIGTVSIQKNELLSEFLTNEGVKHKVLNAKNHENEGEIIAQAGRLGAVTIATNMAGRGVDIKLGGSPATEEEYEKIKELGGLFVLGTERHEARRIDNQLRGRSGRQGDPGETQFFVSMEDSLMRVFASDMVKNMMGRFGIPEDEPIQNKMITKSLETAQNKIEGFNFDSRRHVLQYDDVMNHQRQTIYAKRRRILNCPNEELESVLLDLVHNDEQTLEEASQKKKILGEEKFYLVLRRLLLQNIDILWVEHLELMDHLRSSVRLRAYGQRDPLVEYKKEGLRYFKELEIAIQDSISSTIPKIQEGAFIQEEQKLKEIHKEAKEIGRDDSIKAQPIKSNAPTNDEGGRIGRNDPCFCGSGKKYKKCHGK
jgi:preprotein translocase subunit SecA